MDINDVVFMTKEEALREIRRVVDDRYRHNSLEINYHNALREIIRLNEVAQLLRTGVEELENELARMREEAGQKIDSLHEVIEMLKEEGSRLREQVRWREIGEEQPGEGEEIITIDDNLSANLICFFAKEKEHWIELGIRWMPLPQPPEE